MTKKDRKVIKGFTLVELLVVMAIGGLLAAIAVPAMLNAQRASRNATRLKQLEAVRNSSADYVTRYNVAPSLFNGTVPACAAGVTNTSNICVGSAAADTRAIQAVTTATAASYTFTLVGNAAASCTGNPSANNLINFAYDGTAGIVVLCKEGSGTDTLTFR